MLEVPSLLSLCADAIRDELLRGGALIPYIFDLPSELFDHLLPCLPPLALLRFQAKFGFDIRNDSEIQCIHKRINASWDRLFKARWHSHVLKKKRQLADWLSKLWEENSELTNDFQQLYWEAHLQQCIEEASAMARSPSFDLCIKEIEVPGSILSQIGFEGKMDNEIVDFSKFSHHCLEFGQYVRCLKLPNVFCVREICHLLKDSRLESLEVQWLESKEHVQGLCKFVKQNNGSLKSVKLKYCKLSAELVDAICNSLCKKCSRTCGIQHFSIESSSFLGTYPFPLTDGLASFLSSERTLSLLRLSENHLQKNFAEMVLETLSKASSNIFVLDLSENNITGCISQWTSKNFKILSTGLGFSLQSLRVLNLRNSELGEDDARCLRYVLLRMPNLDTLELSGNPIKDIGIRSLIPYFLEISDRQIPFTDLKLESCELTSYGVNQLLEALGSFKEPLHSLSIGDNYLGSKVGKSLGKFLSKGIQGIDIEDVALDTSGFQDAQREMVGELNLVYVNISKNRGGTETAKFLAKLLSLSPRLVAIDARYNFMHSESLPVLYSGLTAAKGKLQHLDLTGSKLGQEAAPALVEFGIPSLSLIPASIALYDSDV